MLRIFHANSQATLNYLPQVYQNKITLLRTGDRDLGWGELSVESVDIHMIPANHLTMLKKPHVQVLAEQLKACMINSLTNPSC